MVERVIEIPFQDSKVVVAPHEDALIEHFDSELRIQSQNAA